jgi:hypothetical protein
MLHLTCTYTETDWHTISMPIALVPARQWRISTYKSKLEHTNTIAQSMDYPLLDERITVAGDTLHLPDSFSHYTGTLEASTILHNPLDRPVRLVVVAPVPVEVRLDDQLVLLTASPTALPTLHRPEEGSFCDCFIQSGHHRLTLRFLHKPDAHQDGSITIVAASASSDAEPGPYYYLTDMLYL